MVLTVVNEANINKEPYRNLRKHLIANSITTKITLSLTDKTVFPIIVIENTHRQLAKPIGRSGSKSYAVTMTIACFGTGSYESANDELSSILPHLEADELEEVNMSYSDSQLSNDNIQRGGKIYKARVVTVQYVVK